MERVLTSISKIIPAIAEIVGRVMTVFDSKPEDSLSIAAKTDDKDKHDHILAVLKADHDRKMKEAEARLEKEFEAYRKISFLNQQNLLKHKQKLLDAMRTKNYQQTYPVPAFLAKHKKSN